MMRLALPIALVACTAARADVSIDARALAPHTPLGPACDAAIAAAQARFAGSRAPTFHVRERRVVGEYEWADHCDAWGRYALELAPDSRAPVSWHWQQTRDDSGYAIHKRGVRRANGWRARFILDGDNGEDVGDWFVEAFQPAVEACLAGAGQASAGP